MTREFHTFGNGRVDVYPFEYKDYKELLRICLVKRDKSKKESHNYYRWYRNYVMIVLGTNVGARIETLLQLTPKHIEGGYAKIKEFKTNKTQKFKINKDVLKIINDYIDDNYITEHEYLFKTYRNTQKPLTRQQAYNVIEELSKEVGIKYSVGCHSLRKSFGRFIYDKKHDIYVVQRLLGHSSAKITEQYICVKDETIEQIREDSCFL